MKRVLITALVLYALLLCACDNIDPDLYSKIADPAYKLVWSDEFDYQGKPSSDKWVFDVGGHGWGNVEQQYYTDRLENAEVKDGKLIITSREESYEHRYYTSARIKTEELHSWLYGRFEIYARLPKGQGIWSAFWMLPHNFKNATWPQCGELDIMENVGQMPGVIHGTVHTFAYNSRKKNLRTGTVLYEDCYDAFHLYAVEWSEQEIVWYVDDKPFFRYAKEADDKWVWPFTIPFHLIINVAVGGGFGGNVDDDIFPTELIVDYVRVFKLPG
ncbi:MAG: glycoside hydrolase family 16 protein [Spirochaetales bacterium]|nr:glycoside hydrolase family 16 protein [Spirochaetales bacterium]